MKKCHVCLYECEESAELCPICGAQLKAENTENATETENKSESVTVINDPVLAVSVEDVVTAEIFRDILSENNIPFTCDSSESDGSMRVLFGGGFIAEDIYVDSSDLDTAKRLYEEVLACEPEFDEDFAEETE